MDCAVPDCGGTALTSHPFCRPHWRSLPARLRSPIWRHRHEWGTTYQAAVGAALEFIARRNPV